MTVERIENLLEFPQFSTPADYCKISDSRATVVVLPAMGTRASFYQPFAAQLALSGFNVLLPDIPGTGLSRPRPSRKTDYGYRELIETWLPGLETFVRQRTPEHALVFVGHSLGAQLATLATGLARVRPEALVTVAGGHIHYRNWDGAEAAKIRFGAGLFRFLTQVFGYLPGQHVGFGGPQTRSLIRDWSKIIRTGQFSHLAGSATLPGSAPMFCIGYSGDFYAPARSVRALAAVLGGETRVLSPDWPGNPHSAWVKHPESTVAAIDNWLLRRGLLADENGG